MAIQAAKEKAELLASHLGRQVGEALRISEYGGGWYSTYNWWGQYGGYANAMSQYPLNPDSLPPARAARSRWAR
jgi:uncharacterized protein YggE